MVKMKIVFDFCTFLLRVQVLGALIDVRSRLSQYGFVNTINNSNNLLSIVVVLYSQNVKDMKTRAKIETYIGMIEGIRYENQHGGAYAYVQFLAYSRELLNLLRPVKQVEKHLDKIESIAWMFNEYLGASFTQRQKAIFEDNMSETKEVFSSIRSVLKEIDLNIVFASGSTHRQAA